MLGQNFLENVTQEIFGEKYACPEGGSFRLRKQISVLLNVLKGINM